MNAFPLLALFLLALTAPSRLSYDVPKEWKTAPSSSPMRLAQWSYGAESEIVVFYFGEGQGGSVEANLDRWYGQFLQPDGSSTRERAKVTKSTVGELALTRADVSGTYVAPVRPGASERHQKTDYRMIAAVVEGPSGPWFIRFLGPAGEVSNGEDSFDAFLSGLRLE
ncbi:MAG: hypothetical protein ACRD21_06170 [Vicinamibacteria bacterium]